MIGWVDRLRLMADRPSIGTAVGASDLCFFFFGGKEGSVWQRHEGTGRRERGRRRNCGPWRREDRFMAMTGNVVPN